MLSSTTLTGDVTDIFFRTRAAADSNIILSQLSLDGEIIGNLSSSGIDSGSDVDYLQISEIFTPFQIAGKVSMNWTGNQPPTRSSLAYQLKATNTPPSQRTPESGTVSAMFISGFVGLAWLWGRKEDKQKA